MRHMIEARARAGGGPFIVVGVQGRMQHFAFLGVRGDLDQAVDDANQHQLLTGRAAAVLKAQPGQDGSIEVYRSDRGHWQPETREPMRDRRAAPGWAVPPPAHRRTTTRRR